MRGVGWSKYCTAAFLSFAYADVRFAHCRDLERIVAETRGGFLAPFLRNERTHPYGAHPIHRTALHRTAPHTEGVGRCVVSRPQCSRTAVCLQLSDSNVPTPRKQLIAPVPATTESYLTPSPLYCCKREQRIALAW